VALDPASNGSAEGSPERVPELGGPLDGQRVLELATLNAGPSLTAMLGDLGAEVVKVELPSGDDFRILGTATDDALRPGLWNLVARNKRMVTLDYKRPEGVALLAKLTVAADIIVCNQPRSLLERLDCTYESIAARNPRAVVVQVSGWGATGPYADLPGNGTLGEAFAGLTDLQRDASDTPRLTGALLGDHLTALAGVIGTLAACYWRDAQGGTGQLVDVALYEAVVAALGPQIVTWDPEPADDKRPARRAGHGIRDTFRTGDNRWVVVTSYSPAQISRVLEAVGVPVPDDDPARVDLGALVAQWILANDQDTVLDRFHEARIGIAPVNDVGALLGDHHAQARGAIVEIEHPLLGTIRIPRPSPQFSTTPSRVRSVDRALGADNDAVYAEWLGLGPPALDALRAAGII
jgi:crotonobetainyl-CoA:carnitine CoA-transferase CaiB-like acyl-CoA transferase